MIDRFVKGFTLDSEEVLGKSWKKLENSFLGVVKS